MLALTKLSGVICLWQVPARVARTSAGSHLEVQMRSGDIPGRANGTDNLPCSNGLSHTHADAALVSIRTHGAAMVNECEVAVASHWTGEGHDAVAGGLDWRATAGADVDPLVHTSPPRTELARGGSSRRPQPVGIAAADAGGIIDAPA